MNLFLINEDNPNAKTLMEKLVKGTTIKGGAIPLTSGEMNLYNSSDFQWVVSEKESSNNFNLKEMKPNASYVIFCNPKYVNISDIALMSAKLQINLSVIRAG